MAPNGEAVQEKHLMSLQKLILQTNKNKNITQNEVNDK